MTPEQLYKRYKDEFCHMCTKENECNITITQYNGTVKAKCIGYVQNDYCMKHKCNGCIYEEKCFGGGEYANSKTGEVYTKHSEGNVAKTSI